MLSLSNFMNPEKIKILTDLLKSAVIICQSDEPIKHIDDIFWQMVSAEIISNIQQFDLDFRQN